MTHPRAFDARPRARSDCVRTSFRDGAFQVTDDVSTPFNANNLPGHICYILIALSYWLTDIYWLRVIAVVGL